MLIVLYLREDLSCFCGCVLPGEDRILMQCDLRQVRISAEAADCVEPSITAHPVLPASGPDSVGSCLMFGANTTKDCEEQACTTLCATTEKHILWVCSLTYIKGRFYRLLTTSTLLARFEVLQWFSRMLHCQWECSSWPFEDTALWSFQMLGITHPLTQYHIQEELNFQCTTSYSEGMQFWIFFCPQYFVK
jgi:hypothetical protein